MKGKVIMILIRHSKPEDIYSIIALNEDVVTLSGFEDAEWLRELIALSSYCVVAEKSKIIIGFALIIKQHVTYEDSSYQWFSKRLNNFIYIDRIVISEAGKSHQLDFRFHEYITSIARENDFLVIATKEILVLPNNLSSAFHNKNSFIELSICHFDNEIASSMKIKSLQGTIKPKKYINKHSKYK